VLIVGESERVKKGRRIVYAVACFSSGFTRRVPSPGDVADRESWSWLVD